MTRSVAIVAMLLAGGLLVPAGAGCSGCGGPPPVATIVVANDFLVPGSDLNTVRYFWKDAGNPTAVWMEVRDKSGALVRTIPDLPTRCGSESPDYAEQRWDALDDHGVPLTEAASPYEITILAAWGRATASDRRQAAVEAWKMPITIADSGGVLVSGVDQSTVTPETLTITVTVDGGKTATPTYTVGRAGDGACVATPSNLFYVTPQTPYDIRYTVVIEQHTIVLEDEHSLVVKTVMDGLLNPWDMDPDQPGRQTKSIWRFGLLPSSSGSTGMRDFEEKYE
jgi:hypothetical protein